MKLIQAARSTSHVTGVLRWSCTGPALAALACTCALNCAGARAGPLRLGVCRSGLASS